MSEHFKWNTKFQSSNINMGFQFSINHPGDETVALSAKYKRRDVQSILHTHVHLYANFKSHAFERTVS